MENNEAPSHDDVGPDELTKRYYERAERASDIIRQLCFAGLGVIWIFKVDVAGKVILPERFGLAAFFLVIALAFDLFHYLLSAFAWGVCSDAPDHKRAAQLRKLNRVGEATRWFLMAKSVCLIIAGGIMLVYLGHHVWVSPKL